VAKETDEYERVSEEIRSYDALLDNKKGSDSYMGRGTQTLNLAQKNIEITVKGVATENQHLQATNFDIDDENKTIRPTDEEKQRVEFNMEVEKIMEENLKKPNSLINADEMASHISIVTTKSGEQGSKTKASGATSSNSKSGKNKNSKSNINSS